MSNRLRTAIIIICILLMLFSLGLIFYPKIQGVLQTNIVTNTVEEWREQQNTVTSSDTQVESADTPPTELLYPDLLAAMQEYNRNIYENSQDGLVDAWSYQAAVFDLTQYGLENGPVGVISIPAIDVEMPLYLGATEGHMAQGFAQLSQTSMPIGGENTNCVVAGHRGWNNAPYMRDVDKLETGDVVYLENYWGTLEYRICEIKTILPSQIDEILIQPGRDLLTIVTCTPYGIGSHRILVFCERYDTNTANHD